MEMRERLLRVKGTFDPGHRGYPQFSSFDYDRNFYLAAAVMRIPLDGRTFRWLLRGAVGEDVFVWPTRIQVLVPNAGFESGASAPWIPYGAVRTSITSKRHGGKFSLAEISGYGSIYQDVKGLQPGAEYTISAWISSEPGATATAQVAAWDPSTNIATSSMATNPKPDWMLVALEMKANSRGVLRVHLVRNEGKGPIFWDDVEVSLAK
jgi:hypothetical protein